MQHHHPRQLTSRIEPPAQQNAEPDTRRSSVPDIIPPYRAGSSMPPSEAATTSSSNDQDDPGSSDTLNNDDDAQFSTSTLAADTPDQDLLLLLDTPIREPQATEPATSTPTRNTTIEEDNAGQEYRAGTRPPVRWLYTRVPSRPLDLRIVQWQLTADTLACLDGLGEPIVVFDLAELVWSRDGMFGVEFGADPTVRVQGYGHHVDDVQETEEEEEDSEDGASSGLISLEEEAKEMPASSVYTEGFRVYCEDAMEMTRWWRVLEAFRAENPLVSTTTTTTDRLGQVVSAQRAIVAPAPSRRTSVVAMGGARDGSSVLHQINHNWDSPLASTTTTTTYSPVLVVTKFAQVGQVATIAPPAQDAGADQGPAASRRTSAASVAVGTVAGSTPATSMSSAMSHVNSVGRSNGGGSSKGHRRSSAPAVSSVLENAREPRDRRASAMPQQQEQEQRPLSTMLDICDSLELLRLAQTKAASVAMPSPLQTINESTQQQQPEEEGDSISRPPKTVLGNRGSAGVTLGVRYRIPLDSRARSESQDHPVETIISLAAPVPVETRVVAAHSVIEEEEDQEDQDDLADSARSTAALSAFLSGKGSSEPAPVVAESVADDHGEDGLDDTLKGSATPQHLKAALYAATNPQAQDMVSGRSVV
ncbi:hypothetical protein BC828DRAFT_406025 [Blastocladiella britannica]|nr:hypothetical protein BC828DRAFT_406025 [Blastocladiella britannica]